MIKSVYEDGVAEINGNSYEFAGKFNHKERRKVFAYYTKIAPMLEKGDFDFLDSPKFDDIEDLISQKVLFDGQQISKIKDHWDNHADDYVVFITTAIAVVSYPFLKGSLTG